MGKLIEFDFVRKRRPKRPSGDLDCTLRQEDLEEIVQCKRQAHQALMSLRQKQDYVIWHLLNGTPVEPGPRSARLLTVTREPKEIRAAIFYRLMVQ